MKRILLLIAAAVSLSLSAAETRPTTLLIMDADSALIYGAELTSSKSRDTLRSGCDGRIILSVSGRSRVKITADNYEPRTLKLSSADAGKTRVIVLKPKPRSTYSNGLLYRSSRSADEIRIYDSRDAFAPKTAMLMTTGVHAEEMVIEADYEEIAVAEAGSANAIPSAGRLTAGEVNDFAKWALWPDIIGGSHRDYVAKWGLSASHRYTAQVTNRDGYPLAGITVRLTGPKGRVLFSAVTDNTGKAELWNGLTSQPAEGNLTLEADGTRIAASRTSLNLFVLDRPCAAPDVADVFFVFDATGSMGDELRYLQAEMKDVIRRSQSAVEGLSIRTGALVYRDFHDDYLTRIARLSNDIERTQSFIDRQEAGGGGDYEEAVPEALLASLHVAGWSDNTRAKIAFLILDAPCHNDSATLARLHEAVTEAALLGVRIVPVVCSGVDKDGELLMRSLALATNGTSFFLTDDSGIGNTHLKPTTDTLAVEHLNDMLVRTIIEFTRMPDCAIDEWQSQALADDPIEQFLPAPTDDTVIPGSPVLAVSDVLRARPNPCSDVCYADILQDVSALTFCDISGKTIYTYREQSAGTTILIPVDGLSTGVYFLRAFSSGRWYTLKILKS